MALIGSTVDPRMFVQDYSGFQNAAAIKAAGMLNFGNQIGGAIADYGNQQKEAKAGIAKGKAALEFAKTLHPELADQIDQLAKTFQDPSKSQVELAAVGNQMGEHVAALLGEQRFNQEIGLRKQEMTMREKEAGQNSRLNDIQLTSAQMGLAEKQADRDANATIAPVKLAAAIQAIKGAPEISGIFADDYLKKAESMNPAAQSALADTIVSLLPKATQKKFVNDFPVTMGGQAMQMPVMVDEMTGQAQPVQLDGTVLPPKQGGTMDAPPADIFTNEGATIPANEAKLAGQGTAADGTPIEIWQYQGQTYTAPKSAVPAPQGVTVGKAITPPGGLSEKDKFDIAEKQKAGVIAQSAAVAKSQDFLLTLDKLEKHPGFNGLFGFGMGASKVPGTDAASAKVAFDQLQGKGFLESIQDMRGMGALSNAEGEKLSSAFLGLSPDMSEKDAKARIAEIKQLVNKGLNRAATMQQPQEDPLKSAASRLGSMIGPRRLD